MNNLYVKTALRLCLLASVSLSAISVKAEPVQWPVGQNVCQGVWSYSEYQSCEDSSHGEDKTRPIIAENDGARCGYEKMQNSCWHGRVFNNTIDTPVKKIDKIRTDWTDKDFQDYCDREGKRQPLGPQQLLGTITVPYSKKLGRHCEGVDPSQCRIWTYVAEVQCRINIDRQVFGQSDECGPLIDDLTKPKTCVVGYRYINKRSSACKSLDIKTSRLFNASELMKEDWRYNFSCSTGDDLPAETAEEVQGKYKYLVKRIQETQDISNPDFDPLTRSLSTILDQRSPLLTADQAAYAAKVTSKEIKISKLSEGAAYSVADECASNGPGVSRFCPSKRIMFDFGEISQLSAISVHTSIAHKLRFSFPCEVPMQQLSVRLIDGDGEFLLARTPTDVQQSLTMVHSTGQRPPQLEIIADRNALVSDSCKLSVLWSTLDLDPTLLLTSANDLVDKIRLLLDFKNELDKAGQLPAKFKKVQSLKEDVASRITEDIFKCQDLVEAAGKDVEKLCPLNDDPKWACLKAPLTETGEIGVVIKRIYTNSCLYNDIEQGLPETVPCGTTGDQCLEGVQKVAKIAAQEYLNSRSTAETLVKALTSERVRIATKQADLAKKITLVIDSLNKGLAQTGSSAARR